MDSTLLSLTRKVILPDIEFFVNLGDWPLVPNNAPSYPIFSWCGSEDTRDIVMPTYDITESSLNGMRRYKKRFITFIVYNNKLFIHSLCFENRVTVDMLSVQGNTGPPWEEKTEQLFWRGRDSRRERLGLIDISRKYPKLFNTSITNFFFFRDQMDKYGPGENNVPFFDFFKVIPLFLG